MNRQQDIEKLATKVMGWKKCKLCSGFCRHNYVWTEQWGDNCPTHSQHFDINEWNPFESWNDAGMLFETLKVNGKWERFVTYLMGDIGIKASRLLGNLNPNAITEAALKVCEENK